MKSKYFFSSYMFTFHSLVQLLLPMVKLNGVSQPISIEYKIVHGLNQAVFRNLKFRKLSCFGLVTVFSYVLEHVSDVTLLKKLDYLCNVNCKSVISNVCNEVEGRCLQAMKIVHHYAKSCFDWLISGHQSVNPSRAAISVLCGKKTQRFTFVHPLLLASLIIERCHFIFENIPRGLTKECHEIKLATYTDGQLFTYYRNSFLFVHIH